MKFSGLFTLLSILLLINLMSCSKDSQDQSVAIPYVEIYEKINVNDPLYKDLNNIGGWVYLNAGSRGVILYRESAEIIRAYERHCTYDATEVCSTVDMELGLLQANDYDCCGSVFGIATNSVIKGPATRPLLEYHTDFDGTFLVVSN